MKKTQNLILLLFALFISQNQTIGQSQVAITIDDVPNTSNFRDDNFQSKLLSQIDSLKIPVTIFINEKLIYRNDSVVKNFALLNEWIKRKNITLGNHTYNHSRYSEAGLEAFTQDILEGESITRKLADLYKKELKYFRFPFNDLGKTKDEHEKIDSVLKQYNYINTPFTVESSDWVFNAIYENALKIGNIKDAKHIAQKYIALTLELFDFFDSVSIKYHKRKIKHIYLCHDNKLNADYLAILVDKLQKKGYEFINLDEALEDKVYQQKDFYNKKWGISWFYRWIEDDKERMTLLKSEPEMKEIYKKYNEIVNPEKK